MREYSRVEISWPVIFHTVEGLIDGELKNASVEGGLIHCQKLIDFTEPLEVSIEIPGSALPVSATLEIVRSNTHNSGTALSCCELAFRFIEMSEEGRRIFCAALERQAQTRELPQVTRENISIALQAELLRVAEKLAIELECPLNDLLVEAIEDYVKKYENQPMVIRSTFESDKYQDASPEARWSGAVESPKKSTEEEVESKDDRHI